MSMLTIIFGLFSLVLAKEAYQQHLQDSLCTTSHTTAFETFDKEVNFSTSTSSNLVSQKISAVNATAWEQWEFDSVSDSGLAGITIGFNRDASYAFFGRGNLRVEFYAVFEDGSTIQDLDYVNESSVVDCNGHITGTWWSNDRSYSFEVTKDLGRAIVVFNTSRAYGSIQFNSVAPAHFPDGTLFPSSSGSTELSPKLHMSGPIPAARVESNMTIGGRSIQHFGMGGMMRLWALDNWFKLVENFHYIRATAGPYSISFWQPTSRTGNGRTYYSALLFADGDLLVATQIGAPSETEDHILFSDTFGGLGIRGSISDSSTGHVLEFVSPSKGKRWRFTLEHFKKEFEMGLGGDDGLTGFTNRVLGGEVGGCLYEGRAMSEQAAFPEYIAQWKIWVVYGIGFLTRGKDFLMELVAGVI
ncbi:hypothetical protein K490DRAFT_59336 [Saccharata proteae CBS 121410]|uniref:AttH domain-containing protein n=1 Tax=Saccharata proteae CBS 121410 TaxID=1314787 RepID=A0A9P4HRL7_9PEZI|nr:hypothetical protein K490DRAFT_59336 [Saccharata proteae CBS 121410]